jgi:hypothetical protein
MMAERARMLRRSHRSEKLCAFQVKKATGRTALKLSKLPSTRQNVVSPGTTGDDTGVPAWEPVCFSVWTVLTVSVTLVMNKGHNFLAEISLKS